MTIQYDNNMGNMEVTCNLCDDTADIQGTYQECIDELKKDGWEFNKENDEWEHTCPDCWENL